MRALLLSSMVLFTAACSTGSTAPAPPSCDDTPVPATPGDTCTVPGTYSLTGTPRCNQEACSEDALAPYDVTIACNGSACVIEGERSAGGTSTSFSTQCTLNGCACRGVSSNGDMIFDANGFTYEGPAISYEPNPDGGSCSARVYFKATRK